MMAALHIARVVITALIFAFVGLAFLPHFAATRLTGLQKFLSDEIERREAQR